MSGTAVELPVRGRQRPSQSEEHEAAEANATTDSSQAEDTGEGEPTSWTDSDADCAPQTPERSPTEKGVHGSSSAQTVFNIVKNIVGEGMLSLPAGLAAGTGLVVGWIIASVFGLLLGYTFSMMGRVCDASDTTSHKECANRVSGPHLAELMAVVCMLKTAFTCVSYAMVIGQSASRILHFFGLAGFFAEPAPVFLVVMLVVLLPLCMQKDLAVLSYTSLLGILCEVGVVVFMQVRYSDGSYQPGGEFFNTTEERNRPNFGEPNAPHMFDFNLSTCVLFATLSTAFIAHYNAPKFYSQMRRRSVRRFNMVVMVAFAISLAIFVWVMSVGYLTFGKNCRGLILNNYSERDLGATAARFAIGIAVLFGFPLTFTALRDSTMSVFNMPKDQAWVFRTVTWVLLAGITVLGCALDDLGLVNSLGGAIFGGCITLVFPALLCWFTMKAIRKRTIEPEGTRFLPCEMGVSLAVLAIGIFLVFFCSTIVLIKKFAPGVLPSSG